MGSPTIVAEFKSQKEAESAKEELLEFPGFKDDHIYICCKETWMAEVESTPQTESKIVAVLKKHKGSIKKQ